MKQYFAAVIEDDPGYAQYLQECLGRYGEEHDCVFQIRTFGRAEAFLADNRIIDDMVFMDVDLGEVSSSIICTIYRSPRCRLLRSTLKYSLRADLSRNIFFAYHAPLSAIS